MERVKIALQTQDQVGGLKAARRYSNMFDAVTHIVKTQGPLKGHVSPFLGWDFLFPSYTRNLQIDI